MGVWRNSPETHQSGHAPRSGPEVKNGSSAKDGASERLRCGTIQEEVSQILQRVSAGAIYRGIFSSQSFFGIESFLIIFDWLEKKPR